MLHRFRFVIAGILIVLVNQVVTFAVSASMPTMLFPAGTSRYAAAYSLVPAGILDTDGWVDLSGMTKYITIPNGHTADVLVHFCGTAQTDSNSTVWVRALIRDVVASPDGFALLSPAGGRIHSVRHVLPDERPGWQPARQDPGAG